jgi:RNA polymerase sigma-70 factor (ECF subfamily)
LSTRQPVVVFAPGEANFASFFAGFIPRPLAATAPGRFIPLVKSACRPLSIARLPTITDAATTSARAELLAVVRRAQAGDMAAQSDLVRRYTARIAGFVRPIIGQPSAIEDVAQMVFIKMVRRLTLLRDPVTFESWLFALARNTALDFIRRRNCRPVTVSDEGEFRTTPDTNDGRAMIEIMEALDHALVRLSPKDRNLVTHIVQGNSYRTAAAREGLSVGAVKVRLNRVRPFLRVSVSEAIGMTLPAEATMNWRPPPRGRMAA